MAELLVGDVFANAARAVPDRVAAAYQGRTITFGELDRAAASLARTLTDRGVRWGDRVICWSGTSLELPVLFAATAKIGAVLAPVSGLLKREDVDAAAESVQGAWLATCEPFELTALDPGREAAGDGTVRETDPHVIFFTSGSSGAPKGIVLSHRVSMLRTLPGAQLEPRGAMVCSFPLFHMAGWTVSLQQWQARDAIVYLERADGAEICDTVRHYEATRLYCVPAVWQRVLAELDGATLPTLRFADTGTSSTSPDLLDAIARAAPNAVVRVFYGSTEAGNVASATREELAYHPGSCGVPSGLTETRISDSGELEVRGPLVFSEGWYRTGDLATADDAGYLHVVGRIGDVIRTGGEAVVPADVEAALAGCPGVLEAAVVGLPDQDWGELVCAAVVPKDRTDPPTLADLRAWCDGRLAPFQHPRALRVVGSLPRTAATGQVQRAVLVRTLMEE
jgi:acyl-CoA synthetase (AMP-forming)/AMP-acid ligase II